MSETRIVKDVDTTFRWARRSAPALWWLSLLALPLLLALLAATLTRASIEQQLTDATTARLAAAGIDDAQIDFSGRDAHIVVPSADLRGTTKKLIGNIPGIRIVNVTADADGLTRPSEDSDAAKPADDATTDAACADLQAGIDGLLKDQPIQFAESSAVITGTGSMTLKSIADLVSGCSDTKLEVGGHTDNQGSPATSQPLSQARATAVRDALVADGVKAANVTAKGYGESQPVADNSTDAGRMANRRITIKVQ